MWLELIVAAALTLTPLQDEGPNSNWRAMNQTGVELSAAGRYAEADRAFREALRGVEQVAANHDIRASVGQNLAANYFRQGNYREADRLFRRLILELERETGLRHPLLAVPLSNFAALQMKVGKHEESRRLLGRAIECLESDPSNTDGPLLNRLRMRIATHLVFGGKLEEAEAQFRWLIANWRGPGDRADAGYVELMNNYGLLMVRRSRMAEAAEIFKEALELRAKRWPADHPDFLVPLSNLAWCYSRLGRHAEAVALQRRALAICERNGELQTWQCGCLQVQHSEALRKLNRKDEAKVFAQRGKSMMARARSELPGRHTVDMAELVALAQKSK